MFNAVSLDFLKNLEFLATVEAQINEHSKRWTSQNKGQKVLHRQNLGQILQKADKQLVDTLISGQLFFAPNKLFPCNFFLISRRGKKSSQEFYLNHYFFIF